MTALRIINYIVTLLFFICYSYQFVYIFISWFFSKKKKAPKAPQDKNYAVLICARNEEQVIPDLIHSLQNQTYDQSKIHIFVMADNCTDGTAGAAEKAGASVYTRFNQEQVGKGYAMTELMHHLKEDYPDGFDGYFIFDADNVLKADYVEQMNNTFALGYNAVTSYRNSKNFGDNLVSAGSGLWFLRESRYLNHPRYLIGSSCAVSGTGYLLSRKVVEELDGWPFHLLTEDVEFSVQRILQKDKIGYCAEAEYFDEQPTKFRQSFRQRLRWSRGYLQVLHRYGWKMIKGMFTGNFGCFDVFMNIAPAYFLSIVSILLNVTLTIIGIVHGDNFLDALESFTMLIFNTCSAVFAVGLITTITEWRKIRTTTFKKILYTITFPLFMLTYIPIAVAAIFHEPKWKPIEHNVTVEDLKKKEKKSELHDITNNESGNREHDENA